MSVNLGKMAMVIAISGVMLSGCTPIVRNHGYLPVAADVEALAPGTDTKETVQANLGVPTSKGVEGDSSWYYVSYTVQKLAFFAPKVTDREILAVSFDNRGRVAAINRYGLENGVIVDLNTNETVTGGRKLSFLEQMLGNVGNFSAETFL